MRSESDYEEEPESDAEEEEASDSDYSAEAPKKRAKKTTPAAVSAPERRLPLLPRRCNTFAQAWPHCHTRT